MRAGATVGLMIAACIAAVALADDRPALPHDLCAGDGVPAYGALLADGRLAIAAVFGRIDAEPNAPVLARALGERGFREHPPGHFERGPIAVDVVQVIDDRAQVDAALAGVLDRDIIYYNGHEYGGELAALAAPPPGAHVLVLDTCWSTQRYSRRLIAPGIDVIGNSERAVTGSVGSFVALLDGLDERRSWSTLIPAMNAASEQRARTRVHSPFPRPERYRLDVACGERQRAGDPHVAFPAVAW
jgi:hypothetical protein